MKNVNIYLKILVFILCVFATLALSSCFCMHQWDTGEVVKDATCVETGIRRHTCLKCGAMADTEIEKGQHGGKSFVYATCTEGGYTIYDCPVCGHYEECDPVPPRGHKSFNGEIFCSACRAVTIGDNLFVSFLNIEERDTLHFMIESLPVNETTYIIEAELVLSVDDNGELVGEGDALLRDDDDGTPVRIYLSGEVLYLYEENLGRYVSVPLSAIVESNTQDGTTPLPEDMKTLDMEALTLWIEEVLGPLSQVENFDDELNLFLSQVISRLFSVVKNEGRYHFNLDANKIKELNARLGKESVSEFIDNEFGKGSFEEMVTYTRSALLMTAKDVLEKFLMGEISVRELVDKLDALAVILTGDADASMSDILAEGMEREDFDLFACLTDPAFLNKTLADFTAEESEEFSSADELLLDFDTSIAEMREKCFYEIAGVQKSDIEEKVEENDLLIDAYLSLFDFSFAGTAEGELYRVSFSAKLGGTYKTRFTLFFDECEMPDLEGTPQRVEQLRDLLKVENGTEMQKSDNSTYGEIVSSHYEFLSDEDGAVYGIRIVLSTIEYAQTNSEKVEVDGTEVWAFYYDATEQIFSFVLPLDVSGEFAVRQHCCDWIEYAFYQTLSCKYTTSTFVITELLGQKMQYGEKTTVESGEVEANVAVDFLWNAVSGEVSYVGDVDTHEYVYERSVVGANCQEESYDIYGCRGCDLEKKENVTRGAHVPAEGQGYCDICGAGTFNPDDALYIYDSAKDDTYIELYSDGSGRGYIYNNGWSTYSLTWKMEEDKLSVYLPAKNTPFMTFDVVDGEIVFVE